MRVGGLGWERAGGPPLSSGERMVQLGGAGASLLAEVLPRLRLRLARWGLVAPRFPPRVDLEAWGPPDTPAAAAAALLAEVSSPEMVGHCWRTYWFSAALVELAGARSRVDREALYVGAILHDVGLFEIERRDGEHCFSVASAREARRIASAAGWDEARQDVAAEVITANPSASVRIGPFCPEAHYVRLGGGVEVLAQRWKVNPDDLRWILDRHPREGFVEDGLRRTGAEARRNPRGRFGCLGPLFPLAVRALGEFGT